MSIVHQFNTIPTWDSTCLENIILTTACHVDQFNTIPTWDSRMS